MKKKAIIVILFSYMFYLGCSGRTPNPVLYYKPGDSSLSCEELKIQMAEIKREIALKEPKIKERDARNLWLSLCWPIGSPFETDILKAEEIEREALNARYSSLFLLACQHDNCIAKGTFPTNKEDMPLMCIYCGPKFSKAWHIINGQIVCDDCANKKHASK